MFALLEHFRCTYTLLVVSFAPVSVHCKPLADQFDDILSKIEFHRIPLALPGRMGLVDLILVALLTEAGLCFWRSEVFVGVLDSFL